MADLQSDAMKTCRPLPPSEAADFQVCEFALICRRCGFCVVHCTCIPRELAAKTDEFARNGRGSLVLKGKARP